MGRSVLRPYTTVLVGDSFVDEFDDVLRGSAGKENSGDADFFEFGDVGFRDDPAEKDGDVGHALLLEQLHELRADRVVRSRENGESNDVDVFLDGGSGDHLGGLAQAGVNDLHSGVAQSASDHFGTAVVTVEARLGD
jgi:hypothetical protein